MKIRNIFGLSIVLGTIISSTVYAYDLPYNHSALKYTSMGVEIYSMKAKEFLAKGFSGQTEYIRNLKNGSEIKYILGQTGDIPGNEKNDYFYGFDNYRNNNLIGGKGDDFYSCQHTYPIVEKVDEGTDTYYTEGNTGPGKDNVENLISSGDGRAYGNNGDNLIITKFMAGGEAHGGSGNDVFLVNGLSGIYAGDDGIDTVVFSGLLTDYTINGDPWGVTVKNTKTGGNYRLSSHDIEQLGFDDAFFGYEAGENTLKVGPNKTFRKVMDAIHVAGDNDTIEVDSGVYEDDFAIIARSVTIRGVGGRAHFYAKSESFKGKANFITMSANITFDNVEFSGNKVSDQNGAGIRMEGSIPGGIITVKNSYFHNNEVGILAGSQTNGVLNIENTEFGYNGRTTGTVHTVNVGVIKELNIKNSFFHDSMNGHNIRSLANTLNVADSFFYDGTANTSFNIEMAQAQNSNITGNTFVQTESAENTHMILNTATISSSISSNTFVNNASRGVYAIYSSSNLPISLNNNKLYNYKDWVGGTAKFSGNGNIVVDTINVTIPTSNTSIGNIVYNNPAPTTPPVISDASEFTEAATLAKFTGKDITVGVGKNYSSLREAALAAVSGDKIYVDEGVYLSDYVAISNKNLAIIGLGKGAEFKKVATIPNGKALFVSYKSNLYVKNIIFSDSAVPDLNGAGIRYEGGTMTIDNCTFQNNENGILGGATEVGKGKIWINNSKFLNNGRNRTGYTHAIYIGEMDFFEIKNSTVSGTSVGHHVKSRARKTIVENNLLDDAGKDASYNIDLPNGGEALIKGNTIIQSAASPNRTIVSYSAEKNPPNAGKLIIENNSFESFGSTAIGVKNFRDNQVILRNNTFKNISTPYSGNNITVENSGTTVQSPSTPVVRNDAKPPVTPLAPVPTDAVVNKSVTNTTPVPIISRPEKQTIKNTPSTPSATAKKSISVPDIVLLPENKEVWNYKPQIDALVQKNIIKNNMSTQGIDAISIKVENKIQQLEAKSLTKRLSVKENRTYFLLKVIQKSLEEHR